LLENWDGHGSLSPDLDAIRSAKILVSSLPQLLLSDLKPEISADEEGRVIIEWHHELKTLVLFVGAKETIVVQSWGAHGKVEDALLNSQEELLQLLNWLLTPEPREVKS
jgi:hypothetical protein